MLKSRAKPVLASAAVALSLAGCGWMMGDEGRQQATAGPMTQQQQPRMEQQATGPAARQYPQTQGQQAQMQQQAGQRQQEIQAASPQLTMEVQRSLGSQGYFSGPVDGVWGDMTRTSLMNFQRDQGLQQTGQLDRQTLSALQAGGGQMGQQRQQRQPMQQQQSQMGQSEMGQQPGMQQPRQRMGQMGMQQPGMRQQGITPNVVRNLQQELADRGYRVGTVDGVWGPQTRQALTNFQRDRNLRATGQIDRQTLAALGLDAQVGERPDLQRQQRMDQDQLGQQPQWQQQQQQQPDIGPRE